HVAGARPRNVTCFVHVCTTGFLLAFVPDFGRQAFIFIKGGVSRASRDLQVSFSTLGDALQFEVRLQSILVRCFVLWVAPLASGVDMGLGRQCGCECLRKGAFC
ncbi:unnamed protein product, partial [Polarella glacialis]